MELFWRLASRQYWLSRGMSPSSHESLRFRNREETLTSPLLTKWFNCGREFETISGRITKIEGEHTNSPSNTWCLPWDLKLFHGGMYSASQKELHISHLTFKHMYTIVNCLIVNWVPSCIYMLESSTPYHIVSRYFCEAQEYLPMGFSLPPPPHYFCMPHTHT